MTQQRAEGAPPTDAAATYVQALRERLAADRCKVTEADLGGHRVLVGARSDRRARWMGTKAEIFVFALAVPEVDTASMTEFTGWAMDRAKRLRSGLPGFRNVATVLPALVSASVQPAAAKWAAMDARLLGTSLMSRPITVETPATGGARITMYRGRTMWGGGFTGHVLRKASLYFPDQGV
ncbi:hypothetical protein [Streptomyces sp. Ru72]|uniref:hypothetical protein n=1 Tax=Streptomyces sp. Ru72 TaxID=2080747 RepID=UPI000CDD53CA|nr:hypothetical protein [Streptomyces sp. Ru72]POX53169.1 hypothetical protein C3488_05830 [Streptomyces sp. Ru72]